MITLGTTFTGAAFAMRGGEKAKQQGPPINATSKEEENFIKYVASYLAQFRRIGEWLEDARTMKSAIDLPATRKDFSDPGGSSEGASERNRHILTRPLQRVPQECRGRRGKGISKALGDVIWEEGRNRR
jgi:hypothetical protein